MKNNKIDTNPGRYILICGRVELFEPEVLKELTNYYKIIVSGKKTSEMKNRRNLHFYSDEPAAEDFGKLLSVYSPEAVWYVSGFCDGGAGFDDEQLQVEALMSKCRQVEISKLVIISSQSAINYPAALNGTGKARLGDIRDLRCSQLEEELFFYSAEDKMKTILLRVPYLAQEANKDTYLGSLFRKAEAGEEIFLPFRESARLDFLAIQDLLHLLISVTEESMDRAGSYTVYSSFSHSSQDLGQALSLLNPDVTVHYGDKENHCPEQAAITVRDLQKNYGFVAVSDVIGSIPELYGIYKEKSDPPASFREKLPGGKNKFWPVALKYLETGLLFLLVEVLLRYTSDSVYFRYVDLRLFFVLIIGSTHGMQAGIVAGILEALSLGRGFGQIGVSGITLFYDLDYWFPFVIYLMTGAITGYIKSRMMQKMDFLEKESRNIQDKYLFLNRVYNHSIDNKTEYKKQILGFKDSFGKIFEAVEELNSALPSDIFMNGIRIMEKILDNHSIVLYTVEQSQRFGRMVACSPELAAKFPKSLDLGSCPELYRSVAAGETFKNTEFLPGLPMYSYAVVDGGKVSLLINVMNADNSQLGLYYMNQFTILCNLIRLSLLRALKYQEAITEEKFIEGTDILMPPYWTELLATNRKMAESGMTSYMLLKFKEKDPVKIDQMLRGRVRHSDILGQDEDGNILLLLSQMAGENFEAVKDRVLGKELEYSILEEG